jgi:hypothetical protein
VQIILKEPRISKNKIAAKLGVDRHLLDGLLSDEGWRWNKTSNTTGFYAPKTASGTILPFVEHKGLIANLVEK